MVTLLVIKAKFERQSYDGLWLLSGQAFRASLSSKQKFQDDEQCPVDQVVSPVLSPALSPPLLLLTLSLLKNRADVALVTPKNQLRISEFWLVTEF